TLERGSENTKPDLAPGTRPRQIASSAAKTPQTLEKADTRGKTAPPSAELRGQLRSTHTQLRSRFSRMGNGGFHPPLPDANAARVKAQATETPAACNAVTSC